MTKKLWRPAPKKEYKARDPKVTSAMMAAVRHRENKAEVALRRELWRRGLRFRLQSKDLIGRPDIVFPSAKVVVFVDGDFWHARSLVEDGEAAFRATLRTERQEWWLAKLRRNADRDREVTASLRALGWRVLRFWESDVKKDVGSVANRVARAVAMRRKRPK